MPLSAVQSVESFRRAHPVQGLGSLPPPEVRSFGVVGIVVERRVEGLIEGGTRVEFRRGVPHGLRRSLVRLLDDVVADEAVAVPLHRTNEGRLARIVAQRASEDPDRLAQSTVGDHHVAPDRIENLTSRQRLVPPLDEQDEQVEASAGSAAAPDRRGRASCGRRTGCDRRTGSGVGGGAIASTAGSIRGLNCASTASVPGPNRHPTISSRSLTGSDSGGR